MEEKTRNIWGDISNFIKVWWPYILLLIATVVIIWQTVFYTNLVEDYRELYRNAANEDYNSFKEVSIAHDESYEIEQRRGDGNYYYSQLSDDGKAMYRMIYKLVAEYWDGDKEATHKSGKYVLGVLDGDYYPSVKIDSMNVYFAFVYDNPSFLFGGGKYLNVEAEPLIYIDTDGDSSLKFFYTVSVAPEYEGLRQEKASIEEAINNSVSELSATIKDDDSDFVKYVKIYEYIVDNTKYLRDYRSEAVLDEYTNSIIGVLDGEENTGSICQGYASTMTYLCNIFGVECVYVGVREISHAFNLVRIDGVWYYSDSTNGDSLITRKVFFLGGESDYWTEWGCDEPKNSDFCDLKSFEIPETNYPIESGTYTGGLFIY